MDSKLVVGQLTEDWKVEADNLVPLYKEAALRLRRLDSPTRNCEIQTSAVRRNCFEASRGLGVAL